jgi:hypothetical protein
MSATASMSFAFWIGAEVKAMGNASLTHPTIARRLCGIEIFTTSAFVMVSLWPEVPVEKSVALCFGLSHDRF